MRAKRLLRPALVLLAVLAFTAASPADFDDCVQQCIDDFEQDRQACLADFQQCLADVAAEFNDCMDQAQNLQEEYACFQTSNIQQDNCEREADRCQLKSRAMPAICRGARAIRGHGPLLQKSLAAVGWKSRSISTIPFAGT